MTVKAKECLFTSYIRGVVDNLDSGINEPPHRPYGYLLKRCTCKNCMIEKEQNKHMKERMEERKKNAQR